MTKQQKSYPYVSIVMPIRNEERYIERCLDSILDNDYPNDRYEILVIDGMSTDRTREIIKAYSERYSYVKLLDNPKKIRVTANNVGIRAAKGKIIVSMDAHTLYARDYIRQCVNRLQATGAANVGGHQAAVGEDYVTKGIALAVSSPLGIGDAEFRYLYKEKWVDTVYLGTWYKKTLEEIGLFNENCGRVGDYELNYRLRKAGGKILLSPTIKCQYFVRGSLLKLAKQYFTNGIWRLYIIFTHPDSVRWRHLLPPLHIIWLLLTPILLIFGVKLWWFPIAFYLLFTILSSLRIALFNGIKFFPILIPTLWILHTCMGLGFWCGVLRFGYPKLRIKTVLSDIFGKRAF
jgi:glycosyltransferase involved in cell wall biosynthesis